MNMENTVTYGLVDEKNVLFNTVVIVQDDFETLERVKTEEKAFNAYPIDTELYSINIGNMFWNGIEWSDILQK